MGELIRITSVWILHSTLENVHHIYIHVFVCVRARARACVCLRVCALRSFLKKQTWNKSRGSSVNTVPRHSLDDQGSILIVYQELFPHR
jgi:hypothetical protein